MRRNGTDSDRKSGRVGERDDMVFVGQRVIASVAAPAIAISGLAGASDSLAGTAACRVLLDGLPPRLAFDNHAGNSIKRLGLPITDEHYTIPGLRSACVS